MNAATGLDSVLEPLSLCLDAESARRLVAFRIDPQVLARIEMLGERANEGNNLLDLPMRNNDNSGVTGRGVDVGRGLAGVSSHLVCEPDGYHRKIRFPKWKRLYPPGALVRWWRRSIGRILAEEIHRMALRISAILRDRRLLVGYAVAEHPLGYSTATWEEWSTFQHDCISCIQRLQVANRWAGNIDSQMAAEAFLAGAEYAFRNPSRRMSSASQESSAAQE